MVMEGYSGDGGVQWCWRGAVVMEGCSGDGGVQW